MTRWFARLQIRGKLVVLLLATSVVVLGLVSSKVPELEARDALKRRIEQIMTMLGEGVSDRRGRTGAYLHRDRVGGTVKARRSARLAAITSGGAIPDNNNYTVVQWPEETQVGTVDEDFAIDSSAGDIFQLGNTSYRIVKVETGKVMVPGIEDMCGLSVDGERGLLIVNPDPLVLAEYRARQAELKAEAARIERGAVNSIVPLSR